ncbi:sulfurtransferase [Sulfurospirillum sp. 1612]|uniref:sulfurtransferase n=1 Tax=Sulfurospirillum sp. 1612 TaxID=3094835 RepID=UPI002F956453
MKKIFSFFVFVAMVVIPSFAMSLPASHVVSASWLNANAKDVVIVDLSPAKVFVKGHIPGSVNMPLHRDFFKGKMGSVKHLIDTPREIETVLSHAGISNNSTVVFVSHVKKATDYATMTRSLWTAWVYGLKTTAILDGGIEAWVAHGGKLTTAKTVVKPGHFTANRYLRADIAGIVDVESALVNKNVQLADAREPAHFLGKDKDKRLLRHGHIPGAKRVSLYFFQKKEGKLFKMVSADHVKSVLKKTGIALNKPIIAYCNTGHFASADWFVMKFIAGAKQVRNFDASMFGYSRTNLPLVK